MRALLTLAARSAWNRRFVLSLVVLSIALSTLLLLAIERVRVDARSSFSQAMSGIDLIVGARTGSSQLLLYSVFRMGSATNNIRWRSVQDISAHKAVAWVVPISLGDSHRGFSVLATTTDYFKHFRYANKRPLQLAQGTAFAGIFDVVLGAEVARTLGYALGDRIVLSHGDGAISGNDHTDKPFTVVGILQATGTPVDRSLHIGLDGMQAIHLDWVGGVPLPGAKLTPEQASQQDLTPKNVTAVLLGLKNRAAVFSVQRTVADYNDEALMAILPGVALDELWAVIGVGERALLLLSGLVALISLAGLVAVIMAGLNERRRELAILRAVGAGPKTVLLLLAAEGAWVTLSGVLLGLLCYVSLVWGLGDWTAQHFGVALRLQPPSANELMLVGGIALAGGLASLVPGWRAYRLALIDGLSPRV